MAGPASGPGVRAQAPPGDREERAGGALHRRLRAPSRRHPDPGRPAPLARPQSQHEPSAGSLRRAAGDSGRQRIGGARHRPRSGFGVRGTAADRAARQGAHHLLHRRRRQPRDLARGHRQIPTTDARRARVDDVGHARRHPHPRNAHQRRKPRRDPDPDDQAGVDADPHARASSRARRHLRPSHALALRHLRRPADRARLGRCRAGPDAVADDGAGAARLVVGWRRLRPCRRQPRACLVPDGPEPRGHRPEGRARCGLSCRARGCRGRLSRPAGQRPPCRRDGDPARTRASSPQRRRPPAVAPRAGPDRGARRRARRAPGRLDDGARGRDGRRDRAAPPDRRVRADQRRVPLRRDRARPTGTALGQCSRQSGFRDAD